MKRKSPSRNKRVKQSKRKSPSRVKRVKQSKRKSPSRIKRVKQSKRKSPSRVKRVKQSKRKSPSRIKRVKQSKRKSSSSKRSKSKTSRKNGQDCIKDSKMLLKAHQKSAVKRFMKEDGYMFVHGTGTGKTLSAVTASQCFLSDNKRKKVIFVGPTSLLKNFEKELINYGVSKSDIKSKYEFYSFDKIMQQFKKGQPVKCKNNMLIIDEAHNLRNRKEAIRKRGAKDKDESMRYKSIMSCAKQASKRLLLTATPMVNSIGDMFALINMIYGKNLVGTRQEVNKGTAEFAVGVVPNGENYEKLYKLLKGRVDYFVDIANSNFPLAKHHYEEVVMPDNYRKMCMRYMKKHQNSDSYSSGKSSDLDYIFNNPYTFYNAQRRIVNKVKENYFSKKLQKMKEVIKQGKTLIYTNWLDFGVQPISKTLDKMNASYGVFSGKLKKMLEINW